MLLFPNPPRRYDLAVSLGDAWSRPQLCLILGSGRGVSKVCEVSGDKSRLEMDDAPISYGTCVEVRP